MTSIATAPPSTAGRTPVPLHRISPRDNIRALTAASRSRLAVSDSLTKKRVAPRTSHDDLTSSRRCCPPPLDLMRKTSSCSALDVSNRSSISQGQQCRRSSSALSVESHESTLLSDLADAEPSHEALAELNRRKRTSWVDFSADEGGSGMGTTFLQRKVSVLWQSHCSWINFDGSLMNLESEDGEDDEQHGANDDANAIDTKKAGVRFGGPASDTVHFTLTRSEISVDEMYACWYDEYDQEDIQIDVIETIRALRSGGVRALRPGEECERGLEAIAKEGAAEERERVKCRAREAVLSEQDRCRGELTIDGDAAAACARAIASAYRAASESSRRSAEMKGKKDADEAWALRYYA